MSFSIKLNKIKESRRTLEFW